MKLFLLIITALFVASACNIIKPETSPVKLDGPEWKLTAIGKKVVNPDGRAFLKFNEEDREVSGKAFCNSLSADFETMGDNQVTFQDVVSTKMYCEGVMDLEGQMLTNLKEVKTYEIRNGMLYLSSSDEVLLTFKK